MPVNAKLTDDGRHVELTVLLIPAAYAALQTAAERDDCTVTDVVNLAALGYNAVSAAADKTGHNLGGKGTAKLRNNSRRELTPR